MGLFRHKKRVIARFKVDAGATFTVNGRKYTAPKGAKKMVITTSTPAEGKRGASNARGLFTAAGSAYLLWRFLRHK